MPSNYVVIEVVSRSIERVASKYDRRINPGDPDKLTVTGVSFKGSKTPHLCTGFLDYKEMHGLVRTLRSGIVIRAHVKRLRVN
jgi:hypothetical protein